ASDELLDLLGGKARCFRLNVDLRGDKLGKYVERRLHRAPAPEHERNDRQRRECAVVANAQTNKCSHHGYSGSLLGFVSRASNCPAACVTILSPAEIPSLTK